MQFDQVQFRAVAFVLAEAIFGKARAEIAHDRVARDLGNDAGRGNGKAEAIAVDDGGLGQGERKNGKPIDEHVIGPEAERFDGRAHRLVGGAEDVDRVNLKRIDDSDRPGDCLVGDQFVIDFFTAFGEKLLGVVQSGVAKFFGEDHRRRYDRAGERAAARFIEAGDRRDTQGA